MFIGFVAALAVIERGPIGRAHPCLLSCAWHLNCGSYQASVDERAFALCQDFCLAVQSRFIGGDAPAWRLSSTTLAGYTAWIGRETGTMDDAFEDGPNVVWLPSEQAGRPLMDRVCDVEPGVREAVLAAAGLGLVLPALDLRDRVDEKTARHIAEQVVRLTASERLLLLDGLVTPVVGAALRACAEATRASVRCAVAVEEVDQARREGGHWMEPFEERAEVAALEAGRLLVAAYGRCQEAHGVARAVGLARRGEPWTPCDAATVWLAARGAVPGG